MEQKVKQEDSTENLQILNGRLVDFRIDPKTCDTELGSAKVAVFTIADDSNSIKPIYHTVQLWEDKFPENIKDIKEGDLVELKGYNKSFEVEIDPYDIDGPSFSKTGKDTITQFVVTEVLSYQAQETLPDLVKERITLNGYVGQDPIMKRIGEWIDDDWVAAFSIAVKNEGSDKPQWQQVQVWNEEIELSNIEKLKKGDFVEIKGHYSNEFKNKNGITKHDFVLDDCKILNSLGNNVGNSVINQVSSQDNDLDLNRTKEEWQKMRGVIRSYEEDREEESIGSKAFRRLENQAVKEYIENGKISEMGNKITIGDSTGKVETFKGALIEDVAFKDFYCLDKQIIERVAIFYLEDKTDIDKFTGKPGITWVQWGGAEYPENIQNIKKGDILEFEVIKRPPPNYSSWQVNEFYGYGPERVLSPARLLATKIVHHEQSKTLKEIETLKGRLGSDIEIKDIKIKDNTETKKVAVFSVADNSKGKEPVWHNVQLWEDKFPENINEIKKGDLVELKGYNKSFEVKTGETKVKTEFVATEILSHQAKKELGENAKEKVTLKGNLGQDPVITQTINDNTVAAFSIAGKNEGTDKPQWQQVQVWNDAIDKNKIFELKKGDFVEIKGYYGNEYQNKMGETKQDFVLEESIILKNKLENDFSFKRTVGHAM